jgi:phosphatidylethanolamine/phosphatidyl-N-methylethanolamine N-methyltransferase
VQTLRKNSIQAICMTSSLAKTSLPDRVKSRAARFLGPWGVFFKGFVKHPVMVGSIIPSSDRTVAKMLAPVDWANTKLFVEYGPGVGTFCQPVLDKLRPDATLLVIDLNEDFIEYLRKTFRDSRFIAVHGSAADVNEIIAQFGFKHADYILSGLPFSTLPNNLGPVIAEETAKAIRPGGAFLVYQFRARARDFMSPHFRRIDSGFELWNILPCHLFWGWKE